MPQEYPRQYLEGIRLFNEEEFFECHDVLEELWTEVIGEERKFLQGLIQAAVGLFHFENGNLGGARKMCLAACEKLTPYGDLYMGLDNRRFLADYRLCFDELLKAEGGYPAEIVLKKELVPRIVFNPEA